MARTKKQAVVDQEFKESLAIIPEPEGESMAEHKPMNLGDLDRIGGQCPSIGDIIQVTAKPHSHTAWIGIVHEIVDEDVLICYQPDKNRPRSFRVKSGAVTVVGKARLKWSQPLPNENTKDKSYLDKV